MLVEKLTGLVAVRRCLIALRFGRAVGEPLFGDMAFSFAPGGSLARHPQIDDLSHVIAQALLNGKSWNPDLEAFGDNCADTVANG